MHRSFRYSAFFAFLSFSFAGAENRGTSAENNEARTANNHFHFALQGAEIDRANLEKLLTEGANVDGFYNSSEGPVTHLEMATFRALNDGEMEGLNYLLENHAKPDNSKNGMSPLVWVVLQTGYASEPSVHIRADIIVDKLIKAGAWATPAIDEQKIASARLTDQYGKMRAHLQATIENENVLLAACRDLDNQFNFAIAKSRSRQKILFDAATLRLPGKISIPALHVGGDEIPYAFKGHDENLLAPATIYWGNYKFLPDPRAAELRDSWNAILANPAASIVIPEKLFWQLTKSAHGEKFVPAQGIGILISLPSGAEINLTVEKYAQLGRLFKGPLQAEKLLAKVKELVAGLSDPSAQELANTFAR